MSHKSKRISVSVSHLAGSKWDPHFLGYFECFRKQRFFEAHEVLESLWLPARKKPEGNFYKGLIQLAGAFVHVQKRRRGPAAALLKLARKNLTGYPDRYEGLHLPPILALIDEWLERLATHSPIRETPLTWPVLSGPTDQESAT